MYIINKGVNMAIVFKGLKAQYIWWMGGGLVSVLIVFAILYLVGVSTYISVTFALGAATGVIVYVFHLSNTYGQYGMMKKMASRSIPTAVRSTSRRIFMPATDEPTGKKK